MKKALLAVMVIVQLFVFCVPLTAASSDPSDYANYYPQFMDSKESLSTISERDIATWTYKPLLEVLDKNTQGLIDISYNSDPMQKLDIYRWKDNKKRPVIFYIHGGGWAVGDKNDLGGLTIAGKEWLSMGYMIVSINYRLGLIAKDDPTAAKRNSSQPVVDKIDPVIRNAHPTQIEDCAMALKWVIDNIDKYGGDPNKIAIIGISAGGHLAALLSVNSDIHKKFGIDISRIKCWIPVDGIYDCTLPENYSYDWMPAFMKALLDVPEKAIDASPVNHITGNEPPCLIIHGSDDWLVPRTNATQLYKQLEEKGSKNAELEILRGYWHGSALTKYNEPDDKSAKVINKFLSVYLPAEGNNIDRNELDISLRLNNTTLDFGGVKPFIADDGRIMVPSTYVTQNLSAWMQLDSPGIYKITLGAQSFNIEERKLVKKGKTLFVPLRLVSEALGGKIDWIANTKTVVVNFN